MMEKRWTPNTKRTIILIVIFGSYLLISRVSSILPPLVTALILAYILSPIADFFSTRLRTNRTLVVAVIYLFLIAIIIVVPASLIPPLITQIENFAESMPELIQRVGEFIEKPLIMGDFALDLQEIYDQTSGTIEGFLSSLATRSVNILSNIASVLIWTVFILVASFYLVKDSAIIVKWVDEVVPPAYRHDARQLRLRIAASWNAFLRGQLILCVTMGVVVGTTMALIGLPHAWLIGLLFGVLEFIPNLGPTIASVPTVLIALLEGSTSPFFHISNGWFAVVVIGVNFLLQQLENNFLVPRIMGQSLNLHPLVVLIAAIMGAKMAGVLGILLAAPVVATLRVLGEYIYYRLLDMPPFPEVADKQSASSDPQPAEADLPLPTKEDPRIHVDETTVEPAQPLAATESKQTE